MQQSSAGWNFYVHAAFVVSLGLTLLGIWLLPVNLWMKGYLAMGLFFTVGSTVTLAKTSRDNHEQRKLVNRLTDAKTEKMLHEYELKP